MANSDNPGSSNPTKKRKISRVTQFNRASQAARKEREKRAAAAAATSSTSSANSKLNSNKSSVSKLKKLQSKSNSGEIAKHRHRYKSFNDLLSSIHIDVSRSSRSSGISGLSNDPISHSKSNSTYEIDEDSSELSLEERELYQSLNQTNFGSSLLVWKELNLSIPFQNFLNKVIKLSSSLPMIIHHLEEIKEEILVVLHNAFPSTPSSSSSSSSSSTSTYLALEPILDLIPRLSSDLNTEFLPIYPELLQSILRITEINKNHCDGNESDAARIIEKSFESVARIFRELSNEILRDSRDNGGEDYSEETWTIFRPYLGFTEGKRKEKMDSKDEDEEAEEEDEDGMDLDNPSNFNDPDSDQQESSNSQIIQPQTQSQSNPSRAPKLSPHTLRFSSEALAHLVRKSSPKKLNFMTSVMLRDVQQMYQLTREEVGNDGMKKKFNRFKRGVAGVWLEVVKSVDHRLHSKTPDLLDSLFFASNSDSSPNATKSGALSKARSEVVVLTLISIVHHTSRQHLGFLASHLIDLTSKRLVEFQKAQQSEQSRNGSDLQDSLDWLSTLIGVRKGNRIDDSVKPQLFSLLVKLSTLQKEMSSFPSYYEGLSKSITTFMALSIPIGRIQDLVGSGMKSLEISSSIKMNGEDGLSKPFTTLMISLSDPELNWSSFNQFALPVALNSTMKVIQSLDDTPDKMSEGKEVLDFLNRLNQNNKFDHLLTEEGRINPLNSRWIKAVGNYVLKNLQVLEAKIKKEQTELQVEVNDINLIQLSPLFIHHTNDSKQSQNKFANSLKASIQSLTSPENQSLFAEDAYKSQGSLNAFYLLSCLFDSLNSIISQSSSKSTGSFWSGKDPLPKDSFFNIITLTWKSKICVQSLSNLLETLSLKNLLVQLPKPIDVLQYLEIGLMSGDDDLRSSSISILMHCEEYHENERKQSDSNEMDLDGQDQGNGIYRKMFEIERVGITVEGIRDRNVRMRSLARELLRLSNSSHNRASESDSSSNSSRHKFTPDFKSALESSIKYIVSSFKLNFKPIWEESRKALIDLSVKFEDEIWRISFEEMKRSAGGLEKVDVPEEAWNRILSQMKRKEKLESRKHLSEDQQEEEEEELDDFTDFETKEDEEEEVDEDSSKQFIDPQLTNRRNVIKSHLSSTFSKNVSIFEEAMNKQRLVERLDLINYEAQILLLYEQIPKLVEKHNKEFIDIFFERVPFKPDEAEEQEEEQEEERVRDETEVNLETKIMASNTISHSKAVPELSLLQRRTRLCSYLAVFSKFSNPKALSRSSELHSYLYELCSLGDAKIQNLALDCVLTWKHPSQTPYGERMKNLLDSNKFRDELTNFSLASDASDSETPGSKTQPIGSSRGKGKSFKESNKEIRVQEGDRKALMPLLLRLLFGQMISRKGKHTSGSGQAARKTAILISLAGCPPSELETLLDLMLEPFSSQFPTFDASKNGQFVLSREPPKASIRRQNGLLSLMEDLLKHLGLKLIDYWPKLIGVILNLVNHNSQKAAAGKGSTTQSFRNLRALGLRRITDFFRKPVSFDWTPFLPVIFQDIVSPRLELLKIESIQSPSSLMELIHVWSSKTDTIKLLSSQDSTLLPHLFECLSATSVKPSVINKILDVVEQALIVAEEEKENGNVDPDNITNTIVKPYVTPFLSNVGPLLQRTSSLSGPGAVSANKDELMKREISILSSISPFVTSSSDASSLLKILTPMVKKGNKVVTERTKIDLLAIFRDLLLLTPEFRDPESETFKIHYDLFSSLFATLRSRNARISLVEAFVQFKEIDPSLIKVANWVKDLNAFSQKRLDEPDFDKRLDAFDEINSEIENVHLKLSSREWLPLLHNMLHFVLDEQELAIRSNAGTSLKRFVESLSQSQSGTEENSSKRELFLKVVYPGLKKSLKSKFELVRREVLGVLAISVETLGDVGALDEMRGLLADGDAEASFFNNIHHIQVHRRARALRRLGDEASKGVLKSKTISDVLAPLIGHFLNPENVELHDPNLINETITCLGKLSRQLTWSNYNALLWKYLRLANEKSTNEKVFVRASMSILDGFHFSMEEETDHSIKIEEEKEDGEEEEGEADLEAIDEAKEAAETAAAEEARARNVKVLDAVTGKLLPALMNYLSQKDDTDDAVRLPIAVGVIKVAKCLPPAKREAHIHKLLNTLSNVLKSKAQDTRDLARETLWKVSLNLGPSYFPVMVKELRRSLTRGPQLAVLAFTVHALLVHMMSSTENALVDLDQGIEDVVHVATEDIFGHTAEDRDDPGYKSKMREVRQSKSMDTFEQLAKIVVPHRMSSVLLPLRDIMQQTEIPKAMKSIDDVLRRIAAGINSNQHFDSSSLLVLCHTLISRNAAFLQPRKQTGAKVGAKGGPLAGYKFAVLLKRKDVEAALGSGSDHYVRNAHRFVAFGLDLLVTALRRARFDFADTEVLAKLDPMVSVVGNTIYSTEFGVLNLGLKATAGLLKCPVPSLSPSLPVFIKQIFVIIHRSGSAQSDITQTALKTLTSIIRECKDAEIKEKQLTELLALILPDLEEPSAQSTLFGLLRAIVSRKFVVPEVYDVMDKVAEMLVTNQSGQVRELCRATFLQFLLDYPQGKGRLKNQLSFLAKNLSYVYESGRLSVMDLISAIFSKFSDDVIREHSDLFFVALVMVLANDESPKCREYGAKLLRALIGLLEEEQLNKSIQMTHTWAAQTDRQELSKVGMQVYGLLLEGAPDSASNWLPQASRNIAATLKDCAEDLETLETSGEFDDQMDLDLDWQLPYQALQALTKIHKADQSLVSQSTWDSVRRMLLFPHKWVRIASSRLLGSLYSSSTLTAPDMQADITDPLSFNALTDCAKKLSLQLRSSVLDDTLSLQVVKNLLFIGKSLALIKVESKKTPMELENDDQVGEDGIEDEGEDEGDEGSEAEEEQAEITASKIDNSAGIVENPLAWLFSKLSHQARSSQLARKPSGPEVQWSIQPSSILRWFAAMSAHLEPSRVEAFLPHIITPIHRILDDETVKNPQMEELKNLATEVQELVQERVGTTKFATAFQAVRKRTQEKRRERKTARLMQGITNPEAAAKRKAYKNDAKHASRKRKNSAFADRKERIKPLKRHRG